MRRVSCAPVSAADTCDAVKAAIGRNMSVPPSVLLHCPPSILRARLMSRFGCSGWLRQMASHGNRLRHMGV